MIKNQNGLFVWLMTVLIRIDEVDRSSTVRFKEAARHPFRCSRRSDRAVKDLICLLTIADFLIIDLLTGLVFDVSVLFAVLEGSAQMIIK